MELLLARGAALTYNDAQLPRIPPIREHQLPAMNSVKLTPEFPAAQDCVLIATDHSAYDYAFIARHAQLVLDTRNAMRNVQRRDNIRRA